MRYNRTSLSVHLFLLMLLPKPLTVLLLVLLCPLSAMAVWEEIDQFEDGMRIYVQRESLRREGEVSYLDHLVRWPEPQTGEGHAPYRSTRVHVAYHCREKLERYLSSRAYAGLAGDGTVIMEDAEEAQLWYRVSDDSMEGRLWRIACAGGPAASGVPVQAKP